MSTGFDRPASAGRNSRREARTSSGSCGTSSPAASQASAHITPGPPALVTIPTRLPSGSGWVASREATSSSSDRVSVRITPTWSKRASTVRSEAAIRAPVCELVARRPAAERPLFTATMGISRPTRRAIREKRRGSLNDSM